MNFNVKKAVFGEKNCALLSQKFQRIWIDRAKSILSE
jgi:hypothetical protein